MFAVVMLVSASCTAGTGIRTTASTGSVAVTSTPAAETTSTEPATLADSLRAVLADPGFSAELKVEQTLRQPGVVIDVSGAGAISGSDSMFHLEYDFSQLTATVIDTDGRLIGPAGLSARTEESRLVGGNLYEQVDDGRWRLLNLTEGNTTTGHIFDRLGQVKAFTDLGVETIDGVELHHFTPEPLPEYDPIYFDLDPGSLDTFVVLTEVYTDDSGSPRIVEIEVGFEHSDWGPGVHTHAYKLDKIGETITIARPEAWVEISKMGFDPHHGVDLLVPESWTVYEDEPEFISLETNDGYFLIVEPFRAGDPERAMSGWAEAWNAEVVSTQPSDIAVFPGTMASVRFPDGGEGTAYTSAFADAGVAIMWFSPLNDEPRGVFLEEVLRTLVWVNPVSADNLFPGETMADPTLQSDAYSILLLLAEQEDCAEPSVVYTRLASGTIRGWEEDWYLDACGILQTTRIDFTFVADGGTLIEVQWPFDVVDGVD